MFTYMNFYETYDFYLKFIYVKKYIIISKLIIIKSKNTLIIYVNKPMIFIYNLYLTPQRPCYCSRNCFPDTFLIPS